MNIQNIDLPVVEKKQLKKIISIIKSEIEDNLIGLYLFGSSVQGGLKRNSDLDILSVTKITLSQDTRKRLTAQLMELSKKIGEDTNKRYIELTNLIKSDFKIWRHPMSHDYLYGEWLMEDFEKGKIPQREINPDLTIVMYQAKEHSISLLENSINLPSISKRDLKKPSLT